MLLASPSEPTTMTSLGLEISEGVEVEPVSPARYRWLTFHTHRQC